jgi:hypothetical protein
MESREARERGPSRPSRPDSKDQQRARTANEPVAPSLDVTKPRTRSGRLNGKRGVAVSFQINEESEDEDLVPTAEETPQERIADRRNLKRIEKADAAGQKLISKYLPDSIDEFLPACIAGPDDAFTPPPWLMEAIEENKIKYLKISRNCLWET